MLLVRFVTALLLAVAVVVAAAVINIGWLIVIALAVLIATTIAVVLMVLRYTSTSEWLGPDQEAELATAHLVHPETGLPVHHRWNARQTREQADDVARHGVVDVPDDWRGPDGAFRVLLVATDPVSADQLCHALPGVPCEDLAVLVIAPTLTINSRAVALSRPEEAIDHAEETTRTTVTALREAGIHASGHIGPTDPAVALSDGLRTYDAEQVVIARHREQPMRHLEDVPLKRAAEAFGVPLREIPVDMAA